MARNNIGRYAATYAKLLRLYPKAYRQRFAEPMQQMFADMCNEHGQDAHGFVYKIYAETLIGVVTQNIQEVVMNIKTTRSKVIIGISIVGIVAIAIIALPNNHPGAQSIRPGSWLKQVRELSKGDKGACLADVQSAVDAVNHDDGFMEFQGTKLSNFESTAGGAIADVPAGTSFDLTINTYTAKTAKGTMTYEKDYGTYNYTIQKLPANGQWKLVSIIACQQS